MGTKACPTHQPRTNISGRMAHVDRDERVGCLAFSSDPAAPSPASHVLPFHTLPQIADAFDRILRGEAVDPKLERLYRAGRSLGGARPKAVIERDGVVWIAKFARHDDEIDQCAAEH